MKQLVEPGQGEVNSQERKKLGEREMEAAAVAKVFLPGPFHLEASGSFHHRGFWVLQFRGCWTLPSHRLLVSSMAGAAGFFHGRDRSALPYITVCWVLPWQELLGLQLSPHEFIHKAINRLKQSPMGCKQRVRTAS